jgi:hypothetical protein
MNYRERAEHDLGKTLEGRWGLPVALISPDGVRQDSKVDGSPLLGQIMYGLARLNPETGEDVTVDTPVVTLRRSSLIRVPLAGEKWIVEIPETPSMTAPKIQMIISPTKPPEGGKSIGFIRLYLQQVEQEV